MCDCLTHCLRGCGSCFSSMSLFHSLDFCIVLWLNFASRHTSRPMEVFYWILRLVEIVRVALHIMHMITYRNEGVLQLGASASGGPGRNQGECHRLKMGKGDPRIPSNIQFSLNVLGDFHHLI